MCVIKCLCKNLSNYVEAVFEDVLLLTKQDDLWLGMTGGLSTQVKNVFESCLIIQVVFEHRGLIIQDTTVLPSFSL